jgi:tetratricopeptide (TPR) repeat protein
LTSELGDPAGAEPFHERALALAREAGDDRRAGWALHGLGDVAYRRGDLARARELFEESLALFLQLGDLGPAGGRLSYLAGVAMDGGDLDGARVYWERAREIWSQAGDRNGVCAATHGLGDLALESGDDERALAYYAEALELADPESDPEIVANCLAAIAAVLAGRGTGAEAARLWAAAQRLDAEHEALIAAAERARYEPRLDSLPAPDRELSLEDAVALALEVARAGPDPVGGRVGSGLQSRVPDHDG